MEQPVISNGSVQPIFAQQYERYLPTAFDDSPTLLEKVNKIIITLNQIGKLSNDVLDQWNQVMTWVMADGLNASVNAKLDTMNTDGTLAKIINIDILNQKADITYVDGQITTLTNLLTTDVQTINTTIGSETLATTSQTLKGSINEVNGKANTNQLNLAELTKVATSQSEVWKRKGNIFKALSNSIEGAEPNVIVDSNPVIFTGESQVIKMWYRQGSFLPDANDASIRYAESKDGVNFQVYGDVIPHELNKNPYCPFAFKTIDGKYVLYAHHGQTIDGNIYRWDSTDGVNWVKRTVPVLTSAGNGWESSMLGNLFVWQESAADWRMIYEAADANANWKLGYATSADGVTWTKYVNNPVINQITGGGPDVHKINGKYYMWFHGGNLPTDVYRANSTDLMNWSIDEYNPVIKRKMLDEGVNTREGQLSDPCLLEFNGKTYLYYQAIQTQSIFNGLRVMVADMSMSDLVNTIENSHFHPVVGCMLMNTAGQSISSGIGTAIEFNTKQYDPMNMFNPNVNQSMITIKETGFYLISGNIRFSQNDTGLRDLSIIVNGNPIAYQDQMANIGKVTMMGIQTVAYLTVGDQLYLSAYHEAGTNLTLEFVSNAEPKFMVAKVG